MKKEGRDQILLELGAHGFTAQDMAAMRKIGRLAKKHHRLAEMYCNGEGWLRGEHYTLGTPVAGETSGIVGDDDNVFSINMEKIEKKIETLLVGHHVRVEFQNDPRGETVKLYYVFSSAIEIYISDLF